MVKTVRAVFDGEVLRPEEPVDLQLNATYVISIEDETPTRGEVEEGVYPLTAIRRLAVDMGVSDLSTRHDWYAHGRIDDNGHER